MDVSWQVRQSRYRNKHGNKNQPSKIKLIADDPKLMKMFMAVVNDMKSQLESANMDLTKDKTDSII